MYGFLGYFRRFIPLPLTALFVFIATAEIFGQTVEIPTLRHRVTDLSGVLSTQDQSRLEAKLVSFETETTIQIAILILPSTESEPIEAFSLRVAEAWKLGKQKKDNGILILLATKDKKLRIEVGYGLEGDVPDVIAKRIIQQVMVPELKKGKPNLALELAVDALATQITGKPSTAIESYDSPKSSSEEPNLQLSKFHLLLLAVYVILALVLGLTLGVFVTSIGFGALASLYGFFTTLFSAGLLSAFGSAFQMGITGFIVTLILILVVQAKFLGGGFGGYSGGGGGSFGGGFSGGGGSFGGGGSSGSWD